ncbi:hypothetical protein TNCT_515111 [Trichonephila clavata]|uniref:Uncharacterized protein n=1 Tax=Trichonephila clavata TaxID=2740835 RepID=A0A8X6J9J4_TRICU|nr:hypothetical protein TNCT_515111 [Trichonephila clavata]
MKCIDLLLRFNRKFTFIRFFEELNPLQQLLHSNEPAIEKSRVHCKRSSTTQMTRESDFKIGREMEKKESESEAHLSNSPNVRVEGSDLELFDYVFEISTVPVKLCGRNGILSQ